MRQRLERFVAFCAVEEDASALAFTRIIVGTTIVAHLLMALLNGTTTTVFVHVAHGGLNNVQWAQSWATPTAAVLLTLTTATCGLLMAVGCWTRPAVMGAWLGMRVISELSTFAHGGSDALLIDVLFVLGLSGCGNAISIDARRKGATPALRLPRLLLVFQLGLLYFFGGLQKLSWGWVPGGDASALWFALHQPQWTRFDALPPAWTYALTQMATTSTWLFEVAAPLLVASVLLDELGSVGRLVRLLRHLHFRELFLVYGALMHLGIEALMEVGPYLPVTLSLYPTVLGPLWCSRVRARWRREPAAGTPNVPPGTKAQQTR